MTDPEIILHGLRDRDDDSRIALRRIAERCDKAEARVKELEAERGNLIVDVAAEMDRANKAEARVRELENMVTEAHALLQYVDAEIATMPSWQEDRATFCNKFAELVESWDAALAGAEGVGDGNEV